MRSQLEKEQRLAAMLLIAFVVFDAVLWYLVVGRAFAGGNLELKFLDVGQGDSAVIETPNGRESVQILVDGGPDSSVLRELGAALPSGDRYLDLVLMTHPELDHFAGLIEVLDRYEVGAFLGTGRRREAGAYGELAAVLAARDIPYVSVAEGDTIRIGGAALDVLGPSPGERLSGELNNSSIVFKIRNSAFRALFTGDIGSDVEQRLARDYDLRAHVLKVPHHGSRFSSTELFVQEIHPALAVIGVGEKNRYGHPTPDTLERLKRAGAQIFRTDQDGTVRIVLRDGKLKVFTGAIDSGNGGMLQRE
jgi:competence protein ComEC